MWTKIVDFRDNASASPVGARRYECPADGSGDDRPDPPAEAQYGHVWADYENCRWLAE